MIKKSESSYSFKQKLAGAMGAGLYPLLHYYNGNFDIADSWYQLFLLIILCLGLPLICIFLFPLLFNFKKLQVFKSNYLSAINFVVFFGLLALLIFHYNKKGIALVLLMAGILGLLLNRHLNRVVWLQLFLAVLSFMTLLPKIYFMATYNSNWTQVADDIEEVNLKYRPNIYLIQPDGYANSKNLKAPPYSYDNSNFEEWLTQNRFEIYEGFRSNYYSTLTSNSSLFSMKHHHYQNTYPGNLKTYGSQEVIVGKNVTLDILKKNGYTTHLVTDNSFFLTNRKLKAYDFCNIPQRKVLFYDTGGIPYTDIENDFHDYLSTQKGHNFYFIEKTIPSHIMYTKAASLGVEMERSTYLQRLEESNQWLKVLIKSIDEFDPNPLIIIAADHGGYVSLNYVKEVENRKLTKEETVSVFTAFLSIRWPNEVSLEDKIEFDTSVNLFRTLFSVLSERPDLLSHKEDNSSFIPLYEGLNANFYQCLDNNGNYGYLQINPK